MKTVAEMKARLRAIAVEAETAEGEALNALLKEAERIKSGRKIAETRPLQYRTCRTKAKITWRRRERREDQT